MCACVLSMCIETIGTSLALDYIIFIFFFMCLLFCISAVIVKVAGRNSYDCDSDKRAEFEWRRNRGRRCHGDNLLSPSPHPIVVSRSRSNWLWNEGGTEGRLRRRVNELSLSSELGPLINRLVLVSPNLPYLCMFLTFNSLFYPGNCHVVGWQPSACAFKRYIMARAALHSYG